MVYLPQRGATLTVECASSNCTNHFVVAHAFAARFEGEVRVAFFCSELCYLKTMPAKNVRGRDGNCPTLAG